MLKTLNGESAFSKALQFAVLPDDGSLERVLCTSCYYVENCYVLPKNSRLCEFFVVEGGEYSNDLTESSVVLLGIIYSYYALMY